MLKASLRTARRADFRRVATMTVQELNREPLNQAAALRLKQEHQGADPTLLHLLELALIASAPDGEPNNESIRLMEANRFPKATMRLLESEAELTPEEVLTLPMAELADQVIHALTPARPRD